MPIASHHKRLREQAKRRKERSDKDRAKAIHENKLRPIMAQGHSRAVAESILRSQAKGRKATKVSLLMRELGLDREDAIAALR